MKNVVKWESKQAQ